MLQPQNLAVCTVGPGQGVSLCLCGAHRPRRYPRAVPAVPGRGVEGRSGEAKSRLYRQSWSLDLVNISKGNAPTVFASAAALCPENFVGFYLSEALRLSQSLGKTLCFSLLLCSQGYLYFSVPESVV